MLMGNSQVVSRWTSGDEEGHVWASVVVGQRVGEPFTQVMSMRLSNRWFQVKSDISDPAVLLGHEF
jgi:hypothetical protein